MKKIIEMTERYLAHDIDDRNTWSNTWMRENDAMLCELLEAIKHRRQLEQTPITDNWLMAHGFRNEYEKNHLGELHRYTWENGFQRFIVWLDKGRYQCAMLGNYRVKTLADLYDAMELCGITMEDEK